MSPGMLERINEKRSREEARAGKARMRVVLLGVPLLLFVIGFFVYRYYVIHTTIAEVRRIVAEARAYNEPTEIESEKAIAWNSDGYAAGYPAELLAHLEHSAQIAKVLGSVLEKEGRPQSVSSPTVLPDIGLLLFDAETSTDEGHISRDAIVITSLITRQCDAIEDRLNVSEQSFGECLLAGDIVLLRDARGLIERWDLLQAEHAIERP